MTVAGDAPESPDLTALDPARALLAGLDGQPVVEHATVYAEVQERLRVALAALDHV